MTGERTNMIDPTMPELFDALYGLAAADGRGKTLFGAGPDRLRGALESVLIQGVFPRVFLEFPLRGAPYCDLSALYGGALPIGARFCPGAGFGLDGLLDWYTALPRLDGCGLGFELDTGQGRTWPPGVLFQHGDMAELLPQFFAAIGEADRYPACRALLDALPEGWSGVYVGLFPGRPGAPLRVAGYISAETVHVITQDPETLGEDLRQLGFTAFDGEMLRRSAAYLALAKRVEYQLDLCPDGHLSDSLGLVAFLCEDNRDRFSPKRFRSGAYDALFSQLCAEGVADGRWQAYSDCVFRKGLRLGDGALLGLAAGIHSVKLKFVSAKPQRAKAYLELLAKVIGK